ncbi:MAG: YibE/F family protein, partial [Clostridium sp.]|nr:YibE/F family protein [Clostridium sp.]
MEMSLSTKRILWYLIALIAAAALIAAVVRLNSVSKTQLVNRTGQSFEKGVVVRILEDNLQEDGRRIGQQTVLVRMASGEKKGRELTTTSSAGYLSGAVCEVGTRVVVLQSVAGDTVISSVYSVDRGGVILAFAALYLAALCVIGGRKGARGALGLVFTFAAIIYVYLPLVYLGYSPFWSAVAHSVFLVAPPMRYSVT